MTNQNDRFFGFTDMDMDMDTDMNSSERPKSANLNPTPLQSDDIITVAGLTSDIMANTESRSLMSPVEFIEDIDAKTLRPRRLADYIGQRGVCDNLSLAIDATKKRCEPLDHVLLYGPPGLGKTTLATIVANELGVTCRTTSGPVIERPGDLAAILSGLAEHDVLFIDEIHRLNHAVEEVLYPAMEDFSIDIMIGQGPAARSVKLDLKPFTLIGATTRAGLLTAPLRSRFGMIERLEFYRTEELAEIVKRSAEILGVSVDDHGAWEIARRARGTPRICNRLLKRARDFAQERAGGIISKEVADRALSTLDVDTLGLDKMDHMLMKTIIQMFDGGPVGVDTLAAALNEDKGTIEDIYEPYLIQLGFLKRTPRGREVTERALEHFSCYTAAPNPNIS